MGVKKNTITINGRVYDASTGRPITDSQIKTVAKTADSTNISPVKPQPVKPMHKIKVHVASDRTPASQAHAIHVRTERPKTLIRSAVKKPVASKPNISIAAPISQPSHTIVRGTHQKREQRASQTIRSKHISKFEHYSAGVVRKTADIPVKQAPGNTKHAKPQAARYSIQDTPPSLQFQKSPTKQTAGRNIFEDALQTATSHKTVHRAKKRTYGRLGRLGAAGLTVLILGIFFTYQNAPRIALRNAQSSIGFNAKLPGYNPSGFGLSGPVQYQKGMVVINFRSNSDDRQYTVTQASTTLDNTAMVQQYLASQNKSYETTLVKGQPIYIYENSRATWVSHGVWYTIDGNAGLTKDQLTNIVASI